MKKLEFNKLLQKHILEILLCIMTLLGVLFGALFAKTAGPEIDLMLDASYENMQNVSFWTILLKNMLPAAIFLLANTSTLYGMLLPFSIFYKCFSFSYSITLFIKQFGAHGIEKSFLLIGLPNLITIPFLLLLAGIFMRRASIFHRRADREKQKPLWPIAAIYALLIIGISFLQYTLLRR